MEDEKKIEIGKLRPVKKQSRADIVARADDAFGSANYAEYSVNKKVEGRYKTNRTLVILLYILGIGGLAGVLAFVFAPLVAIVPIFGWLLIFFTSPFISVEYKYIVDRAEFTTFTVYGGKLERPTFACKTKSLIRVAPDTDKYESEKQAFGTANTVSLLPTANCEDRYFALCEDENGQKTIVYFQAVGQALKAFKYYNSAATVMTEVSR